MDDYSIASLSESKNEWCARLVNTLTPAIIAGLKSIFDEAWNVCLENDEEDKYLMTFQTFLSRVPRWNAQMVEEERKRIELESACAYLEELVTCVHVIQLKALTCVRVGHKQKKVDIDVPSADQFVHRVYTNVARKLYTNVYLFEKDISPLEVQKHNRELEIIIKECILNAVRDTMPVEKILRAYMDETEEQDVDVKDQLLVKEEPVTEATVGAPPAQPADSEEPEGTPPVETDLPVEPADNIVLKTEEAVQSAFENAAPAAAGSSDSVAPTLANETLTFSNVDEAIDTDGVQTIIEAPKTAERLEKIATESAERARQEREEEEEEDVLKIGGDVTLELADVNDLNRGIALQAPPALDGIEVLDPL